MPKDKSAYTVAHPQACIDLINEADATWRAKRKRTDQEFIVALNASVAKRWLIQHLEGAGYRVEFSETEQKFFLT